MSRISRAIFIVLMFCASGCWLAALQFAPAALQTTVAAASNVAGAAQGPHGNTPGVIELREDATGATEYREMRIAFTSTDVRWTPVVDGDTSAEGWRPAENFLHMNFTPPLPAELSESKTVFLAYAPAYNGASEDNDALIKFNRSFGDPIGTFDWNGRLYQYSLPSTLPLLEYD